MEVTVSRKETLLNIVSGFLHVSAFLNEINTSADMKLSDLTGQKRMGQHLNVIYITGFPQLT